MKQLLRLSPGCGGCVLAELLSPSEFGKFVMADAEVGFKGRGGFTFRRVTHRDGPRVLRFVMSHRIPSLTLNDMLAKVIGEGHAMETEMQATKEIPPARVGEYAILEVNPRSIRLVQAAEVDEDGRVIKVQEPGHDGVLGPSDPIEGDSRIYVHLCLPRDKYMRTRWRGRGPLQDWVAKEFMAQQTPGKLHLN